MLTLNHISYIHSNKEVLFDNVHLAVADHSKIALIGNNGTGKSTLLKIIAGELTQSSGTVAVDAKVYYVPQHVGQFNELTLAQALGVDNKLAALKAITNGEANEVNMELLQDDWLIEERCHQALEAWQLKDVDLHQKMSSLSGGQKTKVFLAGIAIHQSELVLMDEPSNHLDVEGRTLLYEYIQSTMQSLIIVSHDRVLLNLLNTTCELTKHGIELYGGNYDFYEEQKRIETEALHHDIKSKEKALRKAREIEKETLERKHKLDARGKKKQVKAGLPTISMNTFKNNAEKSSSRLKEAHGEKIGAIAEEWQALRKELPAIDKMKMNLDSAKLHVGKALVEAINVNYRYNDEWLWKQALNFMITSGERVAIKGNNGSGKTTLLKMILGQLEPMEGKLTRADFSFIYVDQEYSVIDDKLAIYEQAQRFNEDHLPEHEVKIRLNRFLFSKQDWDKSCSALSGGEKMRLMLSCLSLSNKAPDVIVLDEPTNNLDIHNSEILTQAIDEYKGTLLVVSHDIYFLEQIGITRELSLE